MNWSVAQAKQRLSELLRATVDEPQRIYNRRRLVAAVIDRESFEEFSRWREREKQQSLGDEFAKLRLICEEEGGWELPAAPRQDRPNAFAEVIDDAVRHQRPQ